MLDVGTTDARGGLRAQRPRLALLAPARRDPEQLLLDDVRHGADAALEDGRLLEERRLDLAVAVASGEVAGKPLEARKGGSLVGKQVAGAPGGAEVTATWRQV